MGPGFRRNDTRLLRRGRAQFARIEWVPGSSPGMTTESLGEEQNGRDYRPSTIPASRNIASTSTVCPLAIDAFAAMPVRIDQAPSLCVEARL